MRQEADPRPLTAAPTAATAATAATAPTASAVPTAATAPLATATTPAPSAGAARRAERLATPRLTRELKTIAAMLRIHCADHHAAALAAGGIGMPALCPQCAGLLDYATKRLAACPFGPDKPTCVNCRIHCYGPRQREAVRDVMRYAGPRMLLRHPVLAIAHVIDGRRPAPPKPRGAARLPSAPADRGDPEGGR